ncbi:MAG: hypothetical protein QOJ29_3553 [Thermoleophilaceae bacterium]|jgi:hypothetical protein|nr:hypothetical protein [Thermoleophilaceae bacterium]
MPRSPHDDLRLAIDMLPERTRRAMLAGIRSNEIIVGAYTDKQGRICPMLAAHRNGGRTNFISFAKAWDAFARVRKGPRPATDREVRVLETMLEASLAAEVDLDGVIAEHQALARDRRAREARETGTGWLRRRRTADVVRSPERGGVLAHR